VISRPAPVGGPVGTRILLALAGAGLRLLAALCLGFFLFHVLPGDPVLGLTTGRAVSPEELAARRRELGLDRPLLNQFGSYFADLLRGDLGRSFHSGRPVADLLLERLWPTLLLVTSSAVLATAIGVGSGVLAGWHPGGRLDRVTSTLALVLWATPSAWLGLLLLVGLGSGAGLLPGWLPIGGLHSTPAPSGWAAGALDVAGHLVLPCVTLVAVQYGQYHMLIRASVIAQRRHQYVLVAQATGLRDAVVRRRHVLPNALLPTTTQTFLSLGLVLSGAVSVEAVFTWPGLGYLAYEAVRLPDLPVLQGTLLLFCTGVILMNLIADLAVARLDPRTRQ
jgi:peptide/nickel transport system permease protein